MSIWALPCHMSPWTRTGLMLLPPDWRGRRSRGMTFWKNSSATSLNSGSLPRTVCSHSISERNWRLYHSSQQSVQSFTNGTWPLNVVTWNPNFPVGEADEVWSFARISINWAGSGVSSFKFLYVVKKNDLVGSNSKVPQASGAAVFSGKYTANDFWLSYSPRAIAMCCGL